MSLLIVPVTYESMRMLGAWQSYWLKGAPDLFLLVSVVLPVVWVLAWWSAVVRQATVGVSGFAISRAHFAAVVLGGVFHLAIYLASEGAL